MVDQLDLCDLKSKRGVIKGQLTRFEKLFDKFKPENRFQLESRLDRCDDWWREFQSIQFQIEKLDKSDKQLDERVAFEESFHDIVSEAKRLLTVCTLPESQVAVGGRTDVIKANINLAPIDIPKFDGSYQNWISFRDAFATMIDSNKSLSQFQKFVYLKGSLTGKAFELLENLSLTDDNYKDAMELLKLEYENKKFIVYSHLEALDSLPVIHKESCELLNKFVSEIRKNIRGLKNMDQDVDEWDTFLIFQLQKKLDANTRRVWKEKLEVDEFPTMEQFLEFLTHRSKLLEPDRQTKPETNRNLQNSFQNKCSLSNKNNSNTHRFSKALVSTSRVGDKRCVICGAEWHHVSNCPKFIGLSVVGRRQEIKRTNLCWNCLRLGHRVSQCTSSSCRECGKKHNTLLHEERATASSDNSNCQDKDETSDNGIVENNSKGKTVFGGYSQVGILSNLGDTVLLSTAVVNMEDVSGKSHKCRALLDSGSQSSFISRELRDKLGLPLQQTNSFIQGIGQGLCNVRHYVNGKIGSRFEDFVLKTSFLVIENISGKIPSESINVSSLVIPRGLLLADENFDVPAKIDLLIGAAIFWDLLCEDKISLGSGLPILQSTRLGWVIAGPVERITWQSGKSKKCRFEVCNLVSNIRVQEQLEKFWEIEECSKDKHITEEENLCEEIFMNTTERGDDGKFIVTLPVRDSFVLGNSYNTALKRFGQLEKKLARDVDLKSQYDDFMREYIELGHMSEVRNTDKKVTTNEIYYLPHHAVVKTSSLTTKCRVVFDASAITDNGISLNKKLLVGPKLQDDLFDILVRFRQHRIALTADIAKMYRQVWVRENQRDLQRILWRSKADDPIATYRLNTVTYGTAPASFLAVRCLQQLALENRQNYPEASRVILQDFYMDDLLSGMDSLEDARELKGQVSHILCSGGFVLRKWMSNEKEVLLEGSDGENVEHYISDDSSAQKTLGLYWNSKEDSFYFQIGQERDSKNKVVTKRLILSSVAQIFDPLGILAPVVIRAKIILQLLWKAKLDWDDQVTGEIGLCWERLYRQLRQLAFIRVPRRVICDKPVDIQLHCFSDASEKAYGSCVYIRSTDEQGRHFVRLLCSKSRVAPLKVITLPRLELNGAVISARLYSMVQRCIGFKPTRVVFWCDSTIVLSWLSGQPAQWKTFVSNRVSEVQDLTRGHDWFHVRSESNPADLISRGTDPGRLQSCDLWWFGPEFLARDVESWPLDKCGRSCGEEVPDKRTVRQTFIANVDSFDLVSRFSSFARLNRVVAYCDRFKKNCQLKGSRLVGPLTVAELEESKKKLVRMVQGRNFGADIQALGNGRPVPNNSKLLSLYPFLDTDGILRVGGRLENSELSFNQRHPMVLPQGNTFTKLLIMHYHYKNLHMGPQALLGAIRAEYWPLSGLNTIKQVLKKCVICFRVNPKNLENLMGNLPRSRVVPSRPFSNCGVDFAGPFEIKLSKIRNQRVVKGYVCAFVCFATKAAHLEVVEDLSTESFLNCFKRFISRRGLPVNMYSDNATNFIGTNNSLTDLYRFFSNQCTQNAFSEYFASLRVHWHFIPARSPHFGGLWESVIKAAKYHLRRVIGSHRLTYEQFSTILTQVEACLNSRPLTPLTENPDDLNFLTPGHFLVGTALNALPQEDVRDSSTGRLNKFQLLTQMLQSFWSHWSREYLTRLQQRTKWRRITEPIKCGDLVVLKEDNQPPLKWQMGRVVALHPGLDNQCRVVSLRTSKGVVKRALSRVCVIPFDSEN